MTYAQYVGWSRAAMVVSLERIPADVRTPDQQEVLDQLLTGKKPEDPMTQIGHEDDA